ncbi:MAG: hypothetical protein OSJ60_01820 [Lachnospiraceae bacterium]|nr:hypothetical protein C819_02260 [Lachnospiraceae bacterium 10-1]MCX4350350.1 hypothetical protein [Lachnospiraceae bacterium]
MYAQLEDAGLITGTEEWKKKQVEKPEYLYCGKEGRHCDAGKGTAVRKSPAGQAL